MSVVLPWSTCATIATLRRSSRWGIVGGRREGLAAGESLGGLGRKLPRERSGAECAAVQPRVDRGFRRSGAVSPARSEVSPARPGGLSLPLGGLSLPLGGLSGPPPVGCLPPARGPFRVWAEGAMVRDVVNPPTSAHPPSAFRRAAMPGVTSSLTRPDPAGALAQPGRSGGR